MANEEHLAQLKQGVATWNQWRDKHPEIAPDLRWAELAGRDLAGAQLLRVSFVGANLHQANLIKANLIEADLARADLTRADLQESYLIKASLAWANLCEANLGRAALLGALLIETNLKKANLSGCNIYGISAWGVQLEGACQTNLVIAPGGDEPTITVDNLEVAQFIYLLLHNEKIREVIDTITSKAVLILGRFTPERKAVLEAIRQEIRKQHLNGVPLVEPWTVQISLRILTSYTFLPESCNIGSGHNSFRNALIFTFSCQSQQMPSLKCRMLLRSMR